jgi:SAM-dependent MidA family methyltransferase
MSYDPEDRRDTPFARVLRARIARTGPIGIHTYMAACLGDPEHGYYRTRRAIGRSGDFITAPEMSQVFGELIALWAAVVWQLMGMPRPFNLVEIGPGRGTLMVDALRAAKRVAGFAEAAHVVLVEPNPALEAEQRRTLAGAPASITWAKHLAGLEPAPSIVVANEVLDVSPVSQLVRTGSGWREAGIGLDTAGRLVRIGGLEHPVWFLADTGQGPDGAIYERRDDRELASRVSLLARGGPVAALFVDYGHLGPLFGSTLQAVRKHAFEDPLTSPGEADLTAQVDFAQVTAAFRARRLVVEPLVTQAEFLGTLGAVERGSRLMAANPGRAAEIETGIKRLLSPTGMGTRFKALAIRTPDLPPLPGFASVDITSRRS